METDVTQERLKTLLDYDPETGVFTRKICPRNPSCIGKRSGTIDSHGYRCIKIDGRRYAEHRIVWLFIYGVLPNNEIDHINGDKEDNRFANLREATRNINAQNVKIARCDNKHGFMGVRKDRGRWNARIKINGKYQHLGCFGTPEDAHKAYVAAKRRLHPGSVL